jgi:hypothetical protein
LVNHEITFSGDLDGVAWRSHTEEYLDSCGLFRDAVLAILAAIAKQERVRRSERATAAIARLRRHGEADKLGRPRTEPSKRAKAQKLREHGWSLRDIGAELGISAATVQRIVAGGLMRRERTRTRCSSPWLPPDVVELEVEDPLAATWPLYGLGSVEPFPQDPLSCSTLAE